MDPYLKALGPIYGTRSFIGLLHFVGPSPPRPLDLHLKCPLQIPKTYTLLFHLHADAAHMSCRHEVPQKIGRLPIISKSRLCKQIIIVQSSAQQDLLKVQAD